MAGIYGTIVSRGDVEAALVAHINLWLEAQLEDFEIQRGLRYGSVPRIGPTGVYAGLDAETFMQDNLPAVIVICEPIETPEVSSDGTYLQWYAATVTALAEATTELDARYLADAYGTAVLGAIGQHGSLTGFAMDTRLELAPNARFLDPDKRLFGISETLFHTLIPIMNRRGGPRMPPSIGQEPANYVPATSVDVTLDELTGDAPA